MTFEDYLNQSDAKAQPAFSVMVEHKHLAAKWQTHNGWNVQINMLGDHFTYQCYSESGGPMFTLDNKPSVFYLK